MEELLIGMKDAVITIASPNWADIISAIASVVAVVVAGLIAWKQCAISKKQNEISEQQAKIMDQQNKIAVFDKKFELYTTIEKCLQFANNISYILKDLQEKDLRERPAEGETLFCVQSLFGGMFCDAYVNSESSKELKNVLYYQEVDKIRIKLYQAEFIFSKSISKDDWEHLTVLVNCLINLICADVSTKNHMPISFLMEAYCDAVETVEKENILQKVKDELFLSNILL